MYLNLKSNEVNIHNELTGYRTLLVCGMVQAKYKCKCAGCQVKVKPLDLEHALDADRKTIYNLRKRFGLLGAEYVQQPSFLFDLLYGLASISGCPEVEGKIRAVSDLILAGQRQLRDQLNPFETVKLPECLAEFQDGL